MPTGGRRATGQPPGPRRSGEQPWSATSLWGRARASTGRLLQCRARVQEHGDHERSGHDGNGRRADEEDAARQHTLSCCVARPRSDSSQWSRRLACHPRGQTSHRASSCGTALPVGGRASSGVASRSVMTPTVGRPGSRWVNVGWTPHVHQARVMCIKREQLQTLVPCRPMGRSAGASGPWADQSPHLYLGSTGEPAPHTSQVCGCGAPKGSHGTAWKRSEVRRRRQTRQRVARVLRDW